MAYYCTTASASVSSSLLSAFHCPLRRRRGLKISRQGTVVLAARADRNFPDVKQAAQRQAAFLAKSFAVIQDAMLEAAEKAKDREKLKAEMDMYRVGFKVFRIDVWRSLQVYAKGTHSNSGGPDALRMRRAKEDAVAMLGFLFFAMNTVPLTPFLLPAALEVIPKRWLLPSAFDANRVRAMQTLDMRKANRE